MAVWWSCRAGCSDANNRRFVKIQDTNFFTWRFFKRENSTDWPNRRLHCRRPFLGRGPSIPLPTFRQNQRFATADVPPKTTSTRLPTSLFISLPLSLFLPFFLPPFLPLPLSFSLALSPLTLSSLSLLPLSLSSLFLARSLARSLTRSLAPILILSLPPALHTHLSYSFSIYPSILSLPPLVPFPPSFLFSLSSLSLSCSRLLCPYYSRSASLPLTTPLPLPPSLRTRATIHTRDHEHALTNSVSTCAHKHTLTHTPTRSRSDLPTYARTHVRASARVRAHTRARTPQ